jgi:hypothetical protein
VGRGRRMACCRRPGSCAANPSPQPFANPPEEERQEEEAGCGGGGGGRGGGLGWLLACSTLHAGRSMHGACPFHGLSLCTRCAAAQGAPWPRPRLWLGCWSDGSHALCVPQAPKKKKKADKADKADKAEKKKVRHWATRATRGAREGWHWCSRDRCLPPTHLGAALRLLHRLLLPGALTAAPLPTDRLAEEGQVGGEARLQQAGRRARWARHCSRAPGWRGRRQLKAQPGAWAATLAGQRLAL